MDEIDELVRAIFADDKNEAVNCLVRYVEFSGYDNEYMAETDIERIEVCRNKYGHKK